MYYAGIVEDYYNSARPSYTRNGYEKNVLIDTDSERCLFVSSDVLPQENELLFRLKTAGGQTYSTLKTAKSKKQEKSFAVQTANKTYKGDVQPTTWDNGKEATFCYLPDVLFNEFPMTVKVSNQDKFLSQCMQMQGRECSPYKVLEVLDRQSTVDSPFGLPLEYIHVPYEGEVGKGDFLFHFQYFERVEAGICATFEFIGFEKEDEAAAEIAGMFNDFDENLSHLQETESSSNKDK